MQATDMLQSGPTELPQTLLDMNLLCCLLVPDSIALGVQIQGLYRKGIRIRTYLQISIS